MPIPREPFDNAQDYTFGCPIGEWTARLDHKRWGKNNNLILYFTDINTNAKHWLSVFWNDNFKPRDGSVDFSTEGQVGQTFVLLTRRSDKTGHPVFQSARRKFDDPELIALHDRSAELREGIAATKLSEGNGE